MKQIHEEFLKICKQKLKYFRYAVRTTEIYIHYISKFLETVDKYPQHLVASDFQNYLNNYKFSSQSQQNQIISSIKFLYKDVLGKKYQKVSFKRPRKSKKLPRVIDHHLLKSKIEKVKNIKHRAILALAFSDGLRVSEVINLKVKHIDSNRMIINIQKAKGNKDRVVPLSPYILELLREYYMLYKPKEYLFEGQSGGKYSASSCNNLFKNHIDPAGHFHLLRHSSFTSMLEHGTDIRTIQSIAGHKSSKTTEIYTHISNNILQNAALPM